MEKSEAIAGARIVELLAKIVPNQKKAETISRRTIYDSIFGDYLNVMPSVKYKKVRLSKLSLGQKATVLIKIYLAQGEKPIVIDSHDDHLDNEFIMEELVKALREAKRQRQVIIVSNNGNVVVNSDAEQVIIANRDDHGEIMCGDLSRIQRSAQSSLGFLRAVRKRSAGDNKNTGCMREKERDALYTHNMLT